MPMDNLHTSTIVDVLIDDELEDEDSLPTREMHRLLGGTCQECGIAYYAHEVVWNIALGFKNSPRCLPCLSIRLDKQADELIAQLLNYVQRRECYRRAWKEADRLEGSWNPNEIASKWYQNRLLADAERTMPMKSPSASDQPMLEWDAGDMACGELVMALRMKMKDLPGGSIIRVRATDPAAPEDIPSWCRLSGHSLLSAEVPNYVIQRKGD